MKRRTLPLNLGILALFILGFWQLGSGAYLHAKAQLAQVLLERAWQQTLEGKEEVRPWPWADTYPVAKLHVPRLGIEQIILSGATGRTLAFGPGHTLASSAPGEVGTSVINAHRDTHFRFLQDLQAGDTLTLETPDGKATRYRVTHAEVADTRRQSLSLKTDGLELILVTCYPFNVIAATGPLRYVVTANALPHSL